MSVIDWLREQLGLPPLTDEEQADDLGPPWWLSSEPPPPVNFAELRVVSLTPKTTVIGPGEMFLVEYQGKRYWTMFRCPCGCDEIVTLMAESEKGPTWSTWTSREGRPCLRPSVWRMEGCHSHFWIYDGRVYWCSGSGREPWVAAPKYYAKPK